MVLGHEAYLEAEARSAPKVLSDHLFHYTNADAAIFGIVATGTLRLSPFESTNDLWESRPLYPNLTFHYDDQGLDFGTELWDEIDRNIRRHAKVACLTQDWQLPDYVVDPDAFRGWAHLSLWAHYGAGHAGVCLRFSREKLVEAFMAADGSSRRLDGAVEYLTVASVPDPSGINIGQVREFGVDAAAIAYAEANRESIFFRKHSDWANEMEYRLVQLDQSVLPSRFPFGDALTGMFLGDSFPQGRLVALRAALEAHPGVPVYQLRFHNRRLVCVPGTVQPPAAEEPTSQSPWAEPRRPGTLHDRSTALQDAISTAGALRTQAKAICADVLAEVKDAMVAINQQLQTWPNVQIALYASTTAVPESQRSRRPGVEGERVHFEAGYMCVVEDRPRHSRTSVAAAAIQVLDDEMLRIHAVVSTERWKPDGNEQTEAWRDSMELPLAEASARVDTLMSGLRDAIRAVRSDFESNSEDRTT